MIFAGGLIIGICLGAGLGILIFAILVAKGINI